MNEAQSTGDQETETQKSEGIAISHFSSKPSAEEQHSDVVKRRSCFVPILVVVLVFVAIFAALAIIGAGSRDLSDEELARIRNLEIKTDTGQSTFPGETDSGKKNRDSVTQIEDDSPAGKKSGNQAEKRMIIRPKSGRYCDLFDSEPVTETEHPLDTPIAVAKLGLRHARDDVDDYTATLIKRERIKGKLDDEVFMHVKIRSEQKVDEKIVAPFSVYIKFLAPRSLAGRESVWVMGRNDDRIIGHGTGFTRMIKVNLRPTDRLAMVGNRYPITEIGLEMLALRMLQKGRRDREHGEIEVTVDRTAKIDERPCTKIKLVHPVKRDHFEFHIAEIFIDEEYNVPVRYAAWSWPEETGGEPILEEEYTYRDLKVNVGLTDKDFDTENPKYDFP